MKTAFFTVTAIAFCLTSVLPAFAKDFDATGKNFHPDEISADITVENQKDTDQKQPQKSAEKQLKGKDKKQKNKQKTAVPLKSEPQQTKNSEPALPETNNKTVKTQTVDVASDEQEIDANSGRSGDVEDSGNNSGSDNGSGSDKNSGSDNSSGNELWAYIIFGIIGILLVAIGVTLYLMVKPDKKVTLPGGLNSANNGKEKLQTPPPPAPHSQQSTANNFTPNQQNISSPATSVNSAKERDIEIKISDLNSEKTRLEQEKQGLVDEKATLAAQVSDLNLRINNLEQVNANAAAELEQAKERAAAELKQANEKAAAELEQAKERAAAELKQANEKAAAELEQAKEKAENEKTELKNEYEGKLTTLEEEKKAEVSAAEQKLIDAFPEKTGVFRKWLESTFGNISALHKVMIYSLARLELLSKEANKRPAFDELVRLDDALWAYFGENCTDEYESLNTLRNQLEPICNEILASTEYKIQWTPKGTDVNGDDNYRIVDDSGCVVVVTVKAMIYKGEVVVQKSKVICSAVE